MTEQLVLQLCVHDTFMHRQVVRARAYDPIHINEENYFDVSFLKTLLSTSFMWFLMIVGNK